MSRTITALFDSRHDAEAAKQRLQDARVDADHVRIHDQSTAGDMSRGYSTHQDPGLWGSIKNAFLPDEDRHTYEEGIRRGGYLLTADVDEDEVDDAVRALENANSVDIDERAGQWRSQGWDYPAAGTASGALRSGDYDRDRGAIGVGADEERLEVVEEQLVVGKREVDRGGVRVRSYVTEKPVHEQIRLRDESINVERRPVDRAVTPGDDAFRERTIEMTETDEEAVVAKTARVVEEVVVRKTSDERVEDINETVRRTDVDVEQIGGDDRSGLERTAGRGVAGGGRYDDDREAGTGFGDKAAGLGKEALGNVKQGLGDLTGNEGLKRSGEAQERAGEAQQGKRPD
ncbi:MAG TPA: DUF2382 domain-containing protein [Aurantimonas sp.]|jgi:uncharacterized protein (TIGR02271 family)|nr:DUF2382 domain-containing protein [Aurantimonas sp.]